MSAKQNFQSVVEDAINTQINMELQASYTYTSLAAYFARDNVALPGLTKFFRKSSDEERDHAQKLIDYQTSRGGRVQFFELKAPSADWKSAKNGVESTLQLEKDVNAALLNLHKLADEQNDPQFCDMLEAEYLQEQVEAIKQLADMVTQLNRIGNDGLGLFLFDRDLLSKLEK